MTKIICTISLLIVFAALAPGTQTALAAETTPSTVPQDTVREIKILRNGEHVQLSMDIDIAREKPSSGSVVVYTPRLVGATDSVDFPEVAIFGRLSYYYHARSGVMEGVSDSAFFIRHKGGPRTEHYVRTIRHEPWMDNSILKLVRSEGSDPCHRRMTAVREQSAFFLPPPDTTYIVKKRTRNDEQRGHKSGQARITFRVNRTEILPDQYGNQRELQKIKDAIDEVRANKDVRITKYTLKGYASPEGSYANNVRLAKGRTEALKQFMTDRWGVPAGQIATDYVPEDWAGFRRYVEERRDSFLFTTELLEMIDREGDPDKKLAAIAKRFPAGYKQILEKCFPALRRTDYTIEYEWLRIVERDDGEDREMVITPHHLKIDDALEDDVFTLMRPSRPWLAVKTNLIGDLVLTPNVELEMQLGQDSRWSVMVEDWFPWFLSKKKEIGGIKIGNASMLPTKYSYELLVLGGELRYWWRPRCEQQRPWLTGTFLGAYGAWGKYDWEWNSNGDQGEFVSAGLTIGRAWPLSRHWNMELSASVGALWGPRRHYHGEFGDTHLIWKYTKNLFYAGPTKLKLSLVWLVPSLKSQKKKGGRHE